MPSIDGGPQEDPRWNEPEEKTSPKVLIKYDFENLDVSLYLALREIMGLSQILSTVEKQAEIEKQARDALTAFELSRGPLPDWAADWNWNSALVAGAQLMTKDGRRMGNAHIVEAVKVDFASEVTASNPYGENTYYKCLTDAGNVFTFNSKEIHEAFWIGKFLSTPGRIIRNFDREGHFNKEPK